MTVWEELSANRKRAENIITGETPRGMNTSLKPRHNAPVVRTRHDKRGSFSSVPKVHLLSVTFKAQRACNGIKERVHITEVSVGKLNNCQSFVGAHIK